MFWQQLIFSLSDIPRPRYCFRCCDRACAFFRASGYCRTLAPALDFSRPNWAYGSRCQSLMCCVSLQPCLRYSAISASFPAIQADAPEPWRSPFFWGIIYMTSFPQSAVGSQLYLPDFASIYIIFELKKKMFLILCSPL